MKFFKGVQRAAVVVGLTVCAAGHAVSAEFVMGYGSHFDAPYAVVEDGELVDGWIFSTAKALSEALQTSVAAVAIPRKRSSGMTSNGDIDLYCFTNPTWVRDMRSVTWSESLFEVSNLVTAKKNVAKTLRSPYDLRGLFVGTILGYRYTPLTPFFEHGQIKRVDTKSFDQNLKMLKNGRVEAAIIPDTVADNLLLRLEMADGYAAAPFVVSKRPLHCAISSVKKANQERLAKAIQDLKGNGLFHWPE